MAGMDTVLNSNLSPNQIFYQAEPLEALKANTVYYQLGYKKSLIKSHGQGYTWTLTPIQNAIAAVLSQSGPVAPTNIVTNQVTATVQPYGNVFSASSFLDYTSVINIHEFILKSVKQQGFYTVDSIIRSVLQASTVTVGSNLFASGGATPATIVAGNVLSMTDIRRAAGKLKVGNILRKQNKYMGVIHSATSFDLLSAVTGGSFLDLAKRDSAGLKLIKEAEEISPDGNIDTVGDFAGMVLFETSLNPTPINNSIQTYSSFYFGDECVGVVDLDGDNFKTFVVDASKDPSMYDVIQVIATAIGYRFSMRLLQTCLVLVKTASFSLYLLLLFKKLDNEFAGSLKKPVSFLFEFFDNLVYNKDISFARSL